MQLRLDIKARIGLAVIALAALALAANTLHPLWQPSPRQSMITGYILLAVFVWVWLLPLLRTQTARPAPFLKAGHEWGGMLFLALVCIHAGLFRENLQLWLALTIFAAGLLGALNPRLLNPFSERYSRLWWTLHITLACAITGLAGLHLYASYAYGN